jgi:hypothetical protein
MISELNAVSRIVDETVREIAAAWLGSRRADRSALPEACILRKASTSMNTCRGFLHERERYLLPDPCREPDILVTKQHLLAPV